MLKTDISMCIRFKLSNTDAGVYYGCPLKVKDSNHLLSWLTFFMSSCRPFFPQKCILAYYLPVNQDRYRGSCRINNQAHITSPTSRSVYCSGAAQCILVVEGSLPLEQKLPQSLFSIFSGHVAPVSKSICVFLLNRQPSLGKRPFFQQWHTTFITETEASTAHLY